ncbi:uncharacterized protein LTR77_000134 [Saxophila tyrrhenica]|uniref:Major facilitator superfamily (MFS) profile domain-containing protein n=1 Tax=Saxophila tyrrhenica TaxID=1690608 RepID=A0AAV9PRM6_9PEZI|nr:hypothetical protein LTR77_000134 [Saxophila tyrrhenica]
MAQNDVRDGDGASRRKKQKSEDDKFPTGQMITLAICKFSEPIAFNSVISYAYVMVPWLFDGDGTNASFYAGLLVSAYAFGEVLTAVMWGYASDKMGRKPVVLFGLCGVALSCVMFGLAKSYLVAFVARLIGGMLNGNVAVMQTMLAEMVKRPEHEPTAYAIHPFVWFAGGIIGSAMGGYLAKPAEYWPDVFSPDGIFGEYPFLLPNLVCVVVIVIAVIQGIFFLKETNPHAAENARKKALKKARQSGENTPLLGDSYKDSPHRVSEREVETSESDSSGKPSPALFMEDGVSSGTDPHFDLRRSSFGTMQSIQIQPTRPSLSELNHPADTATPPLRSTFNYTVVMLIASLVLCSYHSMGYFNMLPIYLLDAPSTSLAGGVIDWKGGLGYDIHAVGSFMAMNGFISVVVQGLVFPVFVAKFGVWKSYVVMVILYPLTYPLMPLLTLLPFGPARSAGIYAIMIIQNHLNIIIPPCALILIKNATPSPLVLGTVNGACMSLLSAARTAAPPLEGIIYSKGGSAAAWFSLAGVTVAATVQLWWIPRSPPNAVWIQGVETREGDEEAVEVEGEDRRDER